MASGKGYRWRTVARVVMLSEEEDARLRECMEAVGAETFSRYARQLLLAGVVVPPQVERRQREALAQLEGVAVNLNQIARYVNASHGVTGAQLDGVIALARRAVKECRGVFLRGY